MPRLLHSITVPELLIAADGLQSFDLAVNPLSCVLVVLRPLNDTGTLLNYPRYRDVCAAMNRCSILYLGQAIYSMKGEDIAAMNWLRQGIYPWQGNGNNVDNERRAVVVPLLLGKNVWDAVSCFPPTRRGELQLEIDFDIADTGYDGLRFSVETIELLDAKPKEYEKKTQIVQTFAATGTNDVDLYTGNKCRGVLLFGTTGFTGAVPAPSWGRYRTLLDNREVAYASTDWEVNMMMPSLWGRQPTMSGQHRHTYDGAAAGISQTESVFNVDKDFTQYSFIDFDPTKDDTYTLDTNGFSRFQIRAEAETADAVRAIQIEVIKV